MKNTPIEYENLALLNAPFYNEYVSGFAEVLKSGWFILGQHVKKFEEEFASYVGTSHCVGVASGLDALSLSLAAFNFDKGSEVIVPSNTYIATVLSVLHHGLQPVLVEPSLETYNLDPKKIEEQITSRTRALMVVHLYGKPCEMDPIAAVCKKYNLKLIEDCAQSHGAKYKGRHTGTFGEFGAFSFYPTKNLGALGDAGGVVCNDDRLAALIRRLRNYGSDKKYYNEVVGYNSRLDEVQAAFLSVKLKRLDAINAHKRKLAAVYLQKLKPDFIKPAVTADCFDVYHIFAIRHPRRDALREHLLKNGIKTEIHYPLPPHQQKAMQGICKGQYPISEEIHRTTLSLPISYFHTEEDVYRVTEAMNQF